MNAEKKSGKPHLSLPWANSKSSERNGFFFFLNQVFKESSWRWWSVDEKISHDYLIKWPSYQKQSTHSRQSPSKIQHNSFTGLERTVHHFRRKNKKPRIAKNNPEQQKNCWRSHHPWFQAVLYRSLVIKPSWYWHKNRHVDQWNQI